MQYLSILQTPVLFFPLVFLVSLFVGSFLNVVIHRLPIMMQRDWCQQCHDILELPTPEKPSERYNLLLPPSHCPHCKAPISPWRNIPIFSYLWLKGRAACCGEKISPRYVILECLCPLLASIVAWRFGCSWQSLWLILLTYGLLSASFIDIQHQIIPDDITLPLLWLGLIINTQQVFVTPTTAIIGAVAGYLSLFIITYGYKLLTGKMGMGHGDFKLLALFGAWLGWQLLPFIILLSALLGAVIGITILIVSKRDRSHPIPFGPYIAVAGWLALLWGNEILHWYVGLYT